jgi:hypothetical protein
MSCISCFILNLKIIFNIIPFVREEICDLKLILIGLESKNLFKLLISSVLSKLRFEYLFIYLLENLVTLYKNIFKFRSCFYYKHFLLMLFSFHI